MKTILLMLSILFIAPSGFAQTSAEEYKDQAFMKAIRGLPGDIDSGIEDASMAIKLKPDYHEAYNQRANLKLNKDDLDGALADYSKAIQFGPTVANYYANRAAVREKKKDIPGALADSGKAIALAPKNHHNYYERGKIQLRNKNYAAAILDFDKTLVLSPDYFAARKLRAEAYRALGKNKEADADEKIYTEESKKFFENLKL